MHVLLMQIFGNENLEENLSVEWWLSSILFSIHDLRSFGQYN